MFFAHGVAVEAGEAGFGEDFAEDLFHFLGAVALQADGGVLALGADAGDDGLVAAEVADEAFFGAVIGDGDGAMGAFAGVAAGGAGEGAREAAAVEEEDDLVSGCQFLVHGVAQALGEDGRAAFFGLVAHVDDADHGEGLSVGSLGEGDELVFLFDTRIVVALDGGSGGAEHDAGAFDVGADHREVAAMIFGWVFLFVGGLVFLVDKDEAEVGQGSEDGGARAHDHAGGAFADAMPFVEALPLSEGGVQDGDEFGGLAEAGFEALHGLGGEGDLGEKDDDCFSRFQSRLGGLEIDFGFSGAGDAVEEDGLAAFGGVEGGFDFFEGFRLFGVECFFGVVEEDFVGIGIALDGDVLEDDEAFVGEGFDGGGGAVAQLGDGESFGSAGLQEREDGVLAFGALGEGFEGFGVDVLGGDGLLDCFFGMVFLAHGLGEEGAHDVLERGAVVAGHPVRELEEAGGDERVGVDEGFERAEIELQILRLVHAQDGAGGGAVAEGDTHAMAGHDFYSLLGWRSRRRVRKDRR